MATPVVAAVIVKLTAKLDAPKTCASVGRSGCGAYRSEKRGEAGEDDGKSPRWRQRLLGRFVSAARHRGLGRLEADA